MNRVATSPSERRIDDDGSLARQLSSGADVRAGSGGALPAALRSLPGGRRPARSAPFVQGEQSDAVISTHNLPHPLTSFVGRGHEIAQARRLLATTRLLTLTGAGGIGKTRLGHEVAAGLLDLFQDGVWLVELSALTDPAFVPSAVAAVLGLHEEPGLPLLSTLAEALLGQRLLLVL